MRTPTSILSGLALAFLAGWLIAGTELPVQGQAALNGSFGAVSGEKGGMDLTGPYEVVPNWPKPMAASLPGH